MKSVAFIDASNLFYGGEKSLGWKIDYRKLSQYLINKYKIKTIYYFGGVETCDFKFDYINRYTVPLDQLEKHLNKLLKDSINEPKRDSISRHIKRVKFYRKIESFGYQLILKPVKTYSRQDGRTEKKANCDVDLAFYLMKEKNNFDRVVILSGDGDFLPVLKFLRDQENKEVIILSRGQRTAREIKQFAGSGFRDFIRLKKHLEFIE